MNRNPNRRLGAGPTDAEEIKKHPFFDPVDWDKVLARGYVMPKPAVRPIVHQQINSSIFAEPRVAEVEKEVIVTGNSMNASAMSNSQQLQPANNIPGWSFISPVEAVNNYHSAK